MSKILVGTSLYGGHNLSLLIEIGQIDGDLSPVSLSFPSALPQLLPAWADRTRPAALELVRTPTRVNLS